MNNLNFETNNKLLVKLGIENNANLLTYNKYFKEYMTTNNLDNMNNYIREQLHQYIEKNYSMINNTNADVNYYIERINLFIKKKFRDIISEINISNIISMCDYLKKDTLNNYLYWRNEYYNKVYKILFFGEYKLNKSINKINLIKILEDYWNNLNFENMIEFTNSISKIKFVGCDVDEYVKLIINKFNSSDNIIKLITYINKKFEINEEDNIKILAESEYNNSNNEIDFNSNSSKYNFKFIVNNLKSNGYLLFEEYNKYIINKYKKQQSIETIKNNKKLVHYLTYLISQKDENCVNRKVNEILIGLKNYLEDIEENYYNNISYQKITVKQESEKYKSIDLSLLDRKNATFSIFKYSNTISNNVSNFKLTPEIEPYFDIYKSYYDSRYPNREIEFNPFLSTLIVKMKFLNKTYYIHMAIIQYIVLNKLFNSSNGITIQEISEHISISIENLAETINSLLYCKIIKHNNTSNIEEIKLFINNDYVHENNKISISSLVIKNKEELEMKKEFLHDRNTIILANIYDYIKNNKIFTLDILIENIKNKIPFEIDQNQIDSAIKILLEKEHIGVNLHTNNVITYKYID